MSGWFSDMENKYKEMFDSDSDVNYDKQYLDKFVSLDPTDAGRFAFRGWHFLWNKDYWNKVLENINKAIELDPENPDWYNFRANYFLDEPERAIADYTKAIELDPENPNRYASRARCYSQTYGYEKEAINDYTKAIELDPENPNRYISRADCYNYFLHKLESAIADYTKAIELDPENPNRYASRARCYSQTYKYEKEAIDDYNKAIELDPENPNMYIYRANYYAENNKYTKEAINDYTKAIELDPENPNRYISRADCYTKKNGYEKEAIDDYTKAIELDPENPNRYISRADYYTKKNGYEKEAINDFNKAIELNPENAKYYFQRGKFYAKRPNKNKEEAIADFTKAIEIDNKNAVYYFQRGRFYTKLNVDNEIKYRKAIDDYTTAIEIDPNHVKARFYRGKIYLNITNEYRKAIEDLNIVISIDPYFETSDYMDFYSGSGSLPHGLRGIAYFHLGMYEQAIEDLSLAPEVQEYYTPSEFSFYLSEAKTELARVEERNRIIADLSHSIKNLIATVIDPLQQLKQSPNPQPQIIDNAIRGANLIREIANAMNLSFKGSVEDFRYDARHNDSEDAMSIQRMVVEALKYSAGNMFDGKYFEKFMRKYFPSREEYTRARADWSKATENDALQDIIAALSAHFFEPDISLDDAQAFVLGNERGSAVKLMILFQEMIFNAVKYAAFVPRQERFVRVQFYQEENDVVFWVENAYDPSVRVKTTGLGHVIIKNFAAILGTEPVIHTEANRYSVMIRFSNLWQEEPS